jgi:hypothetical protein
MNDKITTALDDLDDALDELGISGAAYNRPPESQFSWNVSVCGRFVRVWDGETWYARAEDFAEEVSAFADDLRERGNAAIGTHFEDDRGPAAYEVHQAFCDATGGSMDAEDVDEVCEAAFVILDVMEGGGRNDPAQFVAEADDPIAAARQLKAAAGASHYTFDDICGPTLEYATMLYDHPFPACVAALYGWATANGSNPPGEALAALDDPVVLDDFTTEGLPGLDPRIVLAWADGPKRVVSEVMAELEAEAAKRE